MAFMKVCEWNFREPVFIGDTIRCEAAVVGKTEKARGRRGVITWKRTVFNQANHIVQDGTIETLVEGRANVARNASDDDTVKAMAG
ncbi:MAG: hypothetical protein U0744_19550 [Gemmataceae bacterium]